MTDKLATYLLARYDGEASAADEVHTFNCGAHEDDITGYQFILAECDCGEPERIRADVEAKRGVVKLHNPAAWAEWSTTDVFGHRYCPACKESTYDPAHPYRVVPYPCETLLTLAQPYATRDDFRPEWRAGDTR